MAKKKTKSSEVKVKAEKEILEDRSAYNCTECGGDGLKDESTRCPVCSGTGKV